MGSVLMSLHQFLIPSVFSADPSSLLSPFLHLDTQTNVLYEIKQVRSCQNQHIQDVRWSKLVFPLTLVLVGPGEGLSVLPKVRLACRAKGKFHGRQAGPSSPAHKYPHSPSPFWTSCLAFFF